MSEPKVKNPLLFALDYKGEVAMEHYRNLKRTLEGKNSEHT